MNLDTTYTEIVLPVLQTIQPALMGAGGAALVLWWLSKRLVNQQLDKALASHQAKLDQQTRTFQRDLDERTLRTENELGARTERLKNELSMLAHEHNLAASRVDARQAQAIEEVYASINELQWKVIELIPPAADLSPVNDDNIALFYKQAVAAHEQVGVFLRCMTKHAIYIKVETYTKARTTVHDMVGSLYSLLSKIKEAIDSKTGVTIEHNDKIISSRQALREYFQNIFCPMFDELAGHLQIVLGLVKPPAESPGSDTPPR